MKALVIAHCPADHPCRSAADDLIVRLGQSGWVNFTADWHQSSPLLIAAQDQIVGFLRYVIQQIGPESDCPPVMRDGQPLTEAKILAFGVAPEHRRQGIGAARQQAAIDAARAAGCYQVRSHSSDDNRGLYFLLPLRSRPLPKAP